ncbi:MAG: 30S ribosomal protein S12 methylthiotransferase RimO [Lentisphaerae bacterium]|nr:30S ribosomal protein S12 methylthiotransferase RimO [Lentisphaerota bacterium]
MPTHPNKDNSVTPVSVGFVSLGCAKNLVDSQVMAGTLLREDIALAPCPEEADVVIVNTCSFIEEARAESLQTIREVCALKETGRCVAVLVTGCLPQRYRESLQEDLPDVDAFLGLDELDEVGSVVSRLADGARGILDVSARAKRLYDPPVPGVVFTGGPFAYLKVAEGCNHRCAFCAIPGIRGDHRSRSPASLLREAEGLLEVGVRELVLISQDVTSYGSDLADGSDLATLLRPLASLEGDFRIRLLYGFPSRVTDALLGVMAETEKICRYLDLPIQHSHPDMLREMKRAATIPHVEDMAVRIRRALPDVTLRTTCIVGFPGETEEHFQHLLEYVEETEFDHLGVFTFSPEEDTRAFDMAGRIDLELAEERQMRLLSLQREIVDRRAAALVGKDADALLECPLSAGGEWSGRTARQAPDVDGITMITNVPSGAGVGDFIRVRYTGQADYDLTAVALDTET